MEYVSFTYIDFGRHYYIPLLDMGMVDEQVCKQFNRSGKSAHSANILLLHITYRFLEKYNDYISKS